jgi:hypothetical protein
LKQPEKATISFWGMDFQVVGCFRGEALETHADLDGEPLTPVIFPSEAAMEVTEVEMEAIEAGEDVQAFQSRYQHIPGDLTVIMPSLETWWIVSASPFLPERVREPSCIAPPMP